jgi:antitoxin component of RelBE/YafQ-DinJ toxin-antitoxin module
LTVEEAISASALPQDLLSHENQLTSQDLTSLEKNVTKEQSSEEKQQSLKEKSATSEKNDLSSHAQNQQLTLEEKPEACPNLTFVWLNNFIG